MSNDFYPFVDSGVEVSGNRHITGGGDDGPRPSSPEESEHVRYPARVAVYDDPLSTPRVIVVEPKDIRSYLEELTNTVSKLAKEQGSGIPFMVIREIVENFIHAAFIEPTVSILDGGNTIRFADQGPGIQNKELALEPGMTSADAHMKKYIRGVGSGFPTVQQYLDMIGGSLVIEDNMGAGTVVTVTIDASRMEARSDASRQHAETPAVPAPQPYPQPAGAWGQPAAAWPPQTAPQPPYGMPGAAAYGYTPAGYPQAAQWPMQAGMPPTPFPSAASGRYGQVGAPGDGGAVHVTERGAVAMQYLKEHGSCGPTDLARAAGTSVPTWSRELGTLSTLGLVFKQGQKYFLTEVGKSWDPSRA